MIALRQWVERNRRNKWLFPLLLLLLLLLVCVLAFHSWSDAAEVGSGVACVLLGVLITILLVVKPAPAPLRLRLLPARAPPPVRPAQVLCGRPSAACAPLPLRL